MNQVKQKLLLTGATGFLGTALLSGLDRFEVTVYGRTKPKKIDSTHFIHGDIGLHCRCISAFKEVDIVIHCAARVHIMHDNSSAPLEDFREVNTYGTLNLAQQAADAGVKRFIFISSIKVNGESTELGLPFKSDDNFVPTDPYGLSKYEAEVGLREIAARTGMEVVIIRPPLVYGPGVKANFASMMKWVNKGIPLPLGSVNANKRSLVYLDNLVDLIVTCIDHPNAANQTFLVSDDHDVSTTELLREMARGDERPSRLIPVPVGVMQFAANLVGKGAVAARLFGSLQVDIEHTKKVLNWSPPVSFSEGIRRCFYK
ncbi:UDP-glucose 4-epimerase family protein [Paraglaciecola polaris]|uniref:UDP-glucose 4-epimerase n=1 Tax=Paraglaciecola polaris LMG 21857 TaxID=1129793 RepID=K6ZXL3_9ALTE|nr:SDR family oxidoreductase [Paraglaciecola polaris]GAC33488.1 UDP-glucose 4-epimerase [Paraglaciecola polaris LMG 21857]